MTINRHQLEAITNSAQNDAIALAEVYREVFAKKFNAEVKNALNQELSSTLGEHNAIASGVVNSVATSYADTVSIQARSVETVRILTPIREAKPNSSIQALLPPEKPRLRAV